MELLPALPAPGMESVRATGTCDVARKGVLPENLPTNCGGGHNSVHFSAVNRPVSVASEILDNGLGDTKNTRFDTVIADGPGGIRTPDQAIMSRLL